MAEDSDSARFALTSVFKGVSWRRGGALLASAWVTLVWLPVSVLAVSHLDRSGLGPVVGAVLLSSLFACSGLGVVLLLWREMEREQQAGPSAAVQERLEALEVRRVAQEDELESWCGQLSESREESRGLRAELSELRAEKEQICQSAEEELARKSASLLSAQEKLAQMQEVLKRRNKRVSVLEQTARDLNYQLRTVLRLGDLASASPVLKPRLSQSAKHSQEIPRESEALEPVVTAPVEKVSSQYDAYILLHRCLQMAQALTGRYRSEGDGFRGMAPTSHAIDLRRLFDKLRAETAGGILVYSRDERRLLFANATVQKYLGWSPDKLVKDFSLLIRDGKSSDSRGSDFEEQLQALKVGHEAALRLVVRSKHGHEVQLRGCVGIVPSGAFQGLLAAVVYRA